MLEEVERENLKARLKPLMKYNGGGRWSKTYNNLPTEKLRQLLDLWLQRADADARARDAFLRKQTEEPEEVARNDGAYPLSLNHDTGGGYRVIRSTRHLGG